MNLDQKFIESICFQHGEYQLIKYHQKRVNRTFEKFYPNIHPIDLADVLPKIDFDERHKVRVVYSQDVIDIEYSEYKVNPIKSLKVVQDDTVEYEYKFEDRQYLTSLFQKRGAFDDIIIVKNNLVTDSYYANLAFYDGSNWLTPKSYLLPGVKRQYLLEMGLISEIEISLVDIQSFQKISLINAMLNLGEIEIPVSSIEL
ncbi:aminotransferase class IV [Marinoscillum pacificum]|uniref:aminotransferase class IV n=1 Tax=Marinoscillum pacificum TaxID=392723 RepID=UPI0021579703|nr:aminotransferase class IV [Marinoscillum pacificum]